MRKVAHLQRGTENGMLVANSAFSGNWEEKFSAPLTATEVSKSFAVFVSCLSNPFLADNIV